MQSGQRTQVKIPLALDEGPRLTRRHLTITDIQQPTPAQTRLHPTNAGHIERIIGPLAGDDIGGQRHPQGIENRLHHFHLRQVGTVILAVAELEQPVLGHGRVHTGAGAIDVDPFGMQCIDPHHVLIQPRFERHPPRIVTQQVQDNSSRSSVKSSACTGCPVLPRRVRRRLCTQGST